MRALCRVWHFGALEIPQRSKGEHVVTRSPESRLDTRNFLILELLHCQTAQPSPRRMNCSPEVLMAPNLVDRCCSAAHKGSEHAWLPLFLISALTRELKTYLIQRRKTTAFTFVFLKGFKTNHQESIQTLPRCIKRSFVPLCSSPTPSPPKELEQTKILALQLG